jgi:archaetidylinositol phosphate synthase
MNIINFITTYAKTLMSKLAAVIDKASDGRVTPSQITLLSLLGHAFPVWSILTDHLLLAAITLLFFGLMDSLDGALARLQNRSSTVGMFYDSFSDRIKELVIYLAISVEFTQDHRVKLVWAVTATLGSSMLVSYVNAAGEMARSGDKQIKQSDLNKAFRAGIARYEIRMFILVVGLALDNIEWALGLIIVLSLLTAVLRFAKISSVLRGSRVKS